MKRTLPPLLALALAALSPAQAIDTYPDFDGEGIIAFGPDGGTVTFGQSFVAPAQSRLVSFTSSLASLDGVSFAYRFFVSRWDEANRVTLGGPLFASGVLNSPTTLDPSGALVYVPTAVPVDVALEPGGRYMAFYSYENPSDPATGGSAAMPVTFNPYAGGKYLTTTNDGSGLQTFPWDDFFVDNYDLAFRAEFAPVPEPASMAALGLGAVALLRRRRKA